MGIVAGDEYNVRMCTILRVRQCRIPLWERCLTPGAHPSTGLPGDPKEKKFSHLSKISIISETRVQPLCHR